MFYKVENVDGCYAYATSRGIPADRFVEYNPAVKKECSGLWPDTLFVLELQIGATEIYASIRACNLVRVVH
jgi:hypothetical protein